MPNYVVLDEETGSWKGMKLFVNCDAFKAMNVGFCLDEGITSVDDTLYACYEDRRAWQMQVTVHGEGGHGNVLSSSSAMDKARRFINAASEYRDKIIELMKTSDPRDYGRYTSLNINMIDGGYKINVIPSSYKIFVDMRLASDANVTQVEKMIKLWLAAAGNDTELSFIKRDDVSKKTILDDNNPYWVAVRDTVNYMGYNIEPVVLPATSDMLILRNAGVAAIGFAAKTRTMNRVHANNEYLNAETFLKGIDIYYQVLRRLGNVTPC